MRLKTVRLTTIRNKMKWTISVSGGLEMLQMVSESDIGRCASQDARPPRGWIVRSHIGWKGLRRPMRLMTIRNMLKRTISTSDWFEMLHLQGMFRSSL